MTRDEFDRALMTTPFSNRELRLHDAEQRQVIEQLRHELELLKADDTERCTLIRDMEEEERRNDAVIEQQGQHIATLREALQAICSGISGDLLGTTSMDRETMQSIAQQALKEVTL